MAPIPWPRKNAQIGLVSVRRGAKPLLILFASCAFLAGCKKPKPAVAEPPVVQVVSVTPRDVPIYKEWIGSLEGYVNAQIRAQVSGYLLSQRYAEGTQVKKGDLLFEIDPRPFQAALDQVKGKLAQDEAQLKRTLWDVQRYEPLAKENAISQQEFNNAQQAYVAAEAQVKADQATVETAQLNLGFTKIISPIAGLAGVAMVQIGDLVGPNGSVLTTVSTVDPIKVYFTTSEQSYLAYRALYTNETARAEHEQQLELQLILANGATYPHPGKFSFAGREVNPTTGTIQLSGLFPNPELMLRPGQFARVRSATAIRKGALIVPQRAVSELQGTYQIAVVDEQNKVHVRNVKIGDQVGSDWVIDQGLNPNDRVVVEGVQVAKEGVTVNPQPFVTNSVATATGANATASYPTNTTGSATK
jgi:membrane fusion protein (multidrug efflux system)